MTLEEIKGIFYKTSSSASNTARQLTFAGYGVVWVFVQMESAAGTSMPQILFWAVLLLSFGAFCDLIQYILGSVIWFRTFKKHNNKLKKENKKYEERMKTNITTPDEINDPMWVFYVAKMVLLVAAYVLLIVHVLTKVDFQTP